MFKIVSKKIKRKINKKIDKTLKLNEKRVSRFLIALAIVFLISFLVLIYSYNDYFRKLTFDPGAKMNSAFEQKMDQMVQGYPIESMVPQIAQKDKKVAAFMISIAKKESNWGKRVPVSDLDGKNCYNYWGYRGENPIGTGGHTCFKSPQEAVDVVSKRLGELINDDNLDSPQKLVVWKCGDACESDNPMSVRKWIKDVGYYYQKILD